MSSTEQYHGINVLFRRMKCNCPIGERRNPGLSCAVIARSARGARNPPGNPGWTVRGLLASLAQAPSGLQDGLVAVDQRSLCTAQPRRTE